MEALWIERLQRKVILQIKHLSFLRISQEAEKTDLLNNIADMTTQQDNNIVKETESENDWSDIYKSNRKIERKRSYRKNEINKLKRRNSF